MFKTDSFLGNKKLSLNQNVLSDHATMQQGGGVRVLHCGLNFLVDNEYFYWYYSTWRAPLIWDHFLVKNLEDGEEGMNDIVCCV